MSETFHIYVGFDAAETIAYHVLCQSILSRSSMPVAFHPIKQSLLKGIYNRERDPKQSNEFSFTRFLTPYLANFRGWALFIDLDMLVRTDITKLYEMRDPLKAVQVCKHEYTPSTEKKYLGNIQYKYPRKNWSSVMLFNCAHFSCRSLTPEYVNTAPALDLHRFAWCNEDRIGDLSLEWNWLVGEYPYNKEAKIVHFTLGTPCFLEYYHCDYSDEWLNEKAITNHSLQTDD